MVMKSAALFIRMTNFSRNCNPYIFTVIIATESDDVDTVTDGVSDVSIETTQHPVACVTTDNFPYSNQDHYDNADAEDDIGLLL